ncbi:MAG TPA: VWA domain-containing protein [Candidatus Omnitrophota bacterium]|nr:VWA domain-containing protein [Candidatus Omnitrophota bacterium]
MFRFESPEYFLILLIIPIIFFLKRRQKPSVIQFSTLADIKKIKGTGAVSVRSLLHIFRLIAFALMITGLARPQTVESEREFETRGIDIVIALDISGSMLAEDFKPVNRMAVAKEEAKKFVAGRQNDRIGLVVFARKGYTQCPLTLDYEVLSQLIDEIEVGLIKDGTAIGLGIATAVNRLRESDAKSKVIILLTDGENNAGNLDPVTAAELAKTFGIKIYTITIGKGGLVPFPIEDPVFGKRYVQAEVKVDEQILKRIADITDGRHFAAGDPQGLTQAYKRINELETSEVKIKEYSSYRELYHLFLVPGLLMLLAEVLAANTVFLKLP